MIDANAIAAVRISLASPEHIRSWSHGQITFPETLSYPSLQPIPGGLFCERIFGPTRDWTCSCGKYKRAHKPGHVCETCEVELAPCSVRRSRMGHIELASPVCHIWFYKGMPSIIGLLLDLSPRSLQRIVSFERYIVTSIDEQARTHALAQLAASPTTVSAVAGDLAANDHLNRLCASLEALREWGLLEITRYNELNAAFGHVFGAAIGAEAVRDLLASLDLEREAAELRESIRQRSAKPPGKILRRLQVVEAFRRSNTRPEWMVLSVLPVLPAELRPMIPLDNGRYATADLNEIYRRVIHRNNRIKHFRAMGAPAIILHNEQRLLQEACDALFDNARRKPRPLLGSHGQPLKSLTDVLTGKRGRFRHNLLGKRVDYSGRSVICAGLEISLHQCGLPKNIAFELFKPFLIGRLLRRNLAGTTRAAKRMVERQDPLVWDVLAEIMQGRFVLLNRAPTLHRLSIQAFEPVLVEGHAIRLHPLVCSAFNADFDGDQMAVHLPLSDEAQAEARDLMLATRNLRSPASGEPAISISQDMVLGCFYLTQERPNSKVSDRMFTDALEAQLALQHKVIDLHTPITVRLSTEEDAARSSLPAPAGPSQQTERCSNRVRTTVGRLIFNEALPPQLRFRNDAMTKEALKQLIVECLSLCGPEVTAKVADDLKRLGFHYATVSGISIAMSDIREPPEREDLLIQADAQVAEIQTLYREGMITEEERYRQVVTLWNTTTEEISRSLEGTLDPYGSVYTIAKSGATKAKFQQIRQLSGMRGLMASPSGRIIEIPIRGNYKRGLTVAEYLIGSHGARKGTMDRSLNTAKSGYLTRKLVEVGQEVWIAEEDCGTCEGILITEADSRQMQLTDMRSRLVGRILAEPLDGYPQLHSGDEITEALAAQMVQAGVTAVRVRSPLTCQARYGICRKCYGRDLATGQLVRPGTAVGIIAAQSIGEPGTQLTMRTFHSGGIAGAQGDITQGLPRVVELFEAYTPRARLLALLSDIDGVVSVEQEQQSRERILRITDVSSSHYVYTLPPGSQVRITHGQHVQSDQAIALVPGEPGEDDIVLRAPTEGKALLCQTNSGLQLFICPEGAEERHYIIPAHHTLIVEPGQCVTAGTPLTTGVLDLQAILRVQGPLAAQLYLLKEVQSVYRSQGVYINDKHIEVIVRQMLRYTLVIDAGDSNLVPGTIVDRFALAAINASILAQGGEPVQARIVLFGLTKTALHTGSWLAAASFQNTSRVLTMAAIEGKRDNVFGLKERIVVGKTITRVDREQ